MSQKAGIILVVDDERDHADGIVEALEKYCEKAIAVYSAKDAIEIVSAQQVDIVITDLKLGGDIDGLAILAQAKRHNGNTIVILITAYGTIDTCKEAMKRGAYDYLVKPIDIDQLRSLSPRPPEKSPVPIPANPKNPATIKRISNSTAYAAGIPQWRGYTKS